MEEGDDVDGNVSFFAHSYRFFISCKLIVLNEQMQFLGIRGAEMAAAIAEEEALAAAREEQANLQAWNT